MSNAMNCKVNYKTLRELALWPEIHATSCSYLCLPVCVGFEFVLSAERLAASGALEGLLPGVSPAVSTLRGRRTRHIFQILTHSERTG